MQQFVLSYTLDQNKLYAAQVQWPQQCACCGETDPDKLDYYTLTHDAEYTPTSSNTVSFYPLSWPIPYCTTCKIHASRRNTIDAAIFFIAFVIWVGFGYGLFLADLAYDPVGIAIFVVSLAVLVFVGYRLRQPIFKQLAPTTPSCTQVDCVVTAESSAATKQITLTIHNDAYASEFARLNS